MTTNDLLWLYPVGFGFDAVYAEPTIAVVAYVASDSFLKLPTVQLSWESAKVASFELKDTRLVEFLRSRTITGATALALAGALRLFAPTVARNIDLQVGV